MRFAVIATRMVLMQLLDSDEWNELGATITILAQRFAFELMYRTTPWATKSLKHLFHGQYSHV